MLSDGRQVPLGGGKPRVLLATLLLASGRVVTVERLMEAIWLDSPPLSARGVLQTYVASLRRAFADADLPEVIVSHRVGYSAEIPPDTLDKTVFERLTGQGRQAARDGNHPEAANLFRTALALWRGPALSGIGGTHLRAEAARLEELRLTAIEERVTADLAAGREDGLIDELDELIATHPVRERLRRDLMVALYRTGRQADALEVYRRGRRVLNEELGIEPGPELRQAHESILRSDPALLGAAKADPPRQLPSPPSDFTAREAEIAELRDRPGPLPAARPDPAVRPERAQTEESESQRVAVVRRVLGGWLWLVEQLSEAVPTGAIPMRAALGLARPVDPEVARTALADPHGWFRREEESLILAVELAAAMDLDDIAVHLASALSSVAFEGSQYVFDNPFAAWHRTHEAALAVARRMDNARGEATLLAGLGHLYYERDHYAESREYLSQALSLFRTTGDARGEASTLAALGAACREQGYLPEALHFLDRASRQWAGLADPTALAHVKRLSGSVHLERGDHQATWDDLAAALSLYREAGNRRGEGLTLRSMSLYHRARGELERSERLCEEALPIFRELGDRLMEAYCVRSLAKTWMRLGRFDPARRALEGVLATTRTLNDRWGEACTLRTLGELDLAEGRLYQARSRLEESLAPWETLRATLFRARTLRDLAQVYDALGDDASARTALAEALETFRLHEAREARELGG